MRVEDDRKAAQVIKHAEAWHCLECVCVCQSAWTQTRVYLQTGRFTELISDALFMYLTHLDGIQPIRNPTCFNDYFAKWDN